MATLKKAAHLGLVLGGFSLIVAPAFAANAPGYAPKGNDQSEYAVTYQINPAHSGTMKFKGGFSAPLKKLWTVTISGSEVDLSYPVIADGKVFFNEGSNDNANGTSYALDLKTGATLWTQTTGANYVGPAYDRGAIFVVTAGGLIESLSAKSGKLMWSLELPENNGFPAPPVAVNARVYTQAAGGPVYAIDESSGNIVWAVYPTNASSLASPALGSKGVYVAGTCNYVKLDWTTGTVDWADNTCEYSGVNSVTPVYSSSRAYVEDSSAGNSILDAGTGAYIGSFVADEKNPPAFCDVNKQSLGLSLSKGGLYAWDAATGANVWSFAGTNLSTPPIAVNGLVFEGTYSGTVYGLDAATGTQQWADNTGTTVTRLAAGEDTLIVVSEGTINAYVSNK